LTLCLPIIGNYLNIDPLAGGALNLILPYLQRILFVGDGLIAIRTPIRKFLNDLLFHGKPSASSIKLCTFSFELPALSIFQSNYTKTPLKNQETEARLSFKN
jgi:hypothetical protein